MGKGRGVRLSVILVSHNTKEHILDCLFHLGRYPSSYETEFIVVDNASTDGSVEAVAAQYPHVRLFRNRENLGYSGGVNQGIREATGEYYLILNPDIVVKEGSLDRLIEYVADNPDVGIAGSRLLNADGSIQHSPRSFYTFKTFLYRRTPLGRIFADSQVIRDHLMLDWDHLTTRDVDWMLGACLLVRREAVDDVGLMDERFFLYFEDVDWCYRMKAHGWRVVYVADSVMHHLHRRESAGGLWNRRTFIHLASMLRFYDKWSHFLYRMKSQRHFARFFLALVTDLAVINGTFLLAFGIRLLLGAVFTKPVFPLPTYFSFLAFINLTTLVVLLATGFYREEIRLSGASLITNRLIGAYRAAGVGYLVVTAATFLTQTQIYSRVLVTIFFLLLGPLLTAGRYLLHELYSAIQRGAYDLRRVIIVGDGELARRVGDQLRSFPDLGFDLVGFVREDELRSPSESPGVLGGTDDLPSLVREHRVSDVFHVGGGDALPVISPLLLRLSDAPVTVRVVSDLSSIMLAHGQAEEFLNLPMLRFDRRSLIRYRGGRKRLFDFLVAFSLALLTLPLLLMLSLWGTLAGVRPVIERSGKRHFRNEIVMLPRFRVPSGDEKGSRSALASLHRRIPILRCLPLLYPVLSGRLSFVGPHPEEPDSGRNLDEWQRQLVTLRPGLCDVTAMADHPWIPFRDPVGLNMYYLQYWSFSLDLQIMLREWIRSFEPDELKPDGGEPHRDLSDED